MFESDDQSRRNRRTGSLLSIVSDEGRPPAPAPAERAARSDHSERVRQAREIAASLEQARREAEDYAAREKAREADDRASSEHPHPEPGGEASAPPPGEAAAGQVAQSPVAERSGLVTRLKEWRERFRREPASSDGVKAETPPAAEPEAAARYDVSAAIEDGDGDPMADDRQDPQGWRPLFDPVRVIAGVWHSKTIILATTILGGAIGVWIALATPKKYEAVTEIVFDPRNISIVERELTQQGLPSDATLALVENQVRVMTSVNVLNKVIDRLGLLKDPEFNGKGSGGPFSFLSEWRSLLSGSSGAGGGEGAQRSITAGNLYDSLDVVRRGKTFVIAIGATSEDPEKSALIANTITEEFIKTYGELQSGTAGRATEELTARLDDLRAEVEAAERAVEVYKAENDIINPQGRLITDDEIVRLNEQLTVARARTIELNARASTARGVDVDAALTGALPEEVSSSVMTELRSQHAALRQEHDRLAVRLGPRHPQLLALESQLAGARTQIANELRRLVSSVQLELRRAVQLEQDLASRLAQLKARSATVGEELVELRELERKASTARAVYEAFLLRARETGEQQSLNTANVSVISTAYPPVRPTGPSRSTIALAGAMLGFLAGLTIGAGRGILDSVRASGVLPATNSGGTAPGGGRTRRVRRPAAQPPAAEPAAVPQAPAAPRVAAANTAEPGNASSVAQLDETPFRDFAARHSADPVPDRTEPEQAEVEATLAEIRESLRDFRETMRSFEERRAHRDAASR